MIVCVIICDYVGPCRASRCAQETRPPSLIQITRPKYRQNFYVAIKVATAVGIGRLNKQNISAFAYFDWWLKQKQLVLNVMPVAVLLQLHRFKETHHT